ncbi:MAG: FecR domain-containing protein [Kiloniellales bacterium]|nr:FecR domain-containing protein [Kiloniellales bacterium]
MTGSNAEHDPIREEALDWLLKIEAAPGDEALRHALEAWRSQSEAHDRAYQSVARVWRLAGELPPDDTGQADRAGGGASKPQARAGQERRACPARSFGGPAPPTRPGRRRRVLQGAVAAAFLAAVLSYLAPTLRLRLLADHVTGVGEIRSVTLEDGSRMHLDAESAVAVGFEAAERRISLIAGQAFFEVAPAPARPFTVGAEGVSVTVTGTAFSVRTRSDGIAVAVVSGSVKVAPGRPGNEVFALTAGEQVSLAPATGSVLHSRVRPADVAPWRDRQLVADGLPLGEVVEQLGRHHRGAILLRDPALAKRRITGVFDLNDPLGALRAAAGTQDARVIEVTPYLLIVDRR